jgi:hypothetical protein
VTAQTLKLLCSEWRRDDQREQDSGEQTTLEPATCGAARAAATGAHRAPLSCLLTAVVGSTQTLGGQAPDSGSSRKGSDSDGQRDPY